MLAKIAGAVPDESPGSPNLSDFLNEVRRAVSSLETIQGTVITMYHFENLDFDQIAAALDLPIPQVKKLHGEALVILKYGLAEAVNRRWPGRFDKMLSCPICSHPKRELIERIITGKKEHESWGTINRRLKSQIGRIIHPPALLINHQKYHKKG